MPSIIAPTRPTFRCRPCNAGLACQVSLLLNFPTSPTTRHRRAVQAVCRPTRSSEGSLPRAASLKTTKTKGRPAPGPHACGREMISKRDPAFGEIHRGSPSAVAWGSGSHPCPLCQTSVPWVPLRQNRAPRSRTGRCPPLELIVQSRDSTTMLLLIAFERSFDVFFEFRMLEIRENL